MLASRTGRPNGGRKSLDMVVDARPLYASGLGRYIRSILSRLLLDGRFSSFTLLGDPDEIQDFARTNFASDRIHAIDYPIAYYSPRIQLAWMALRARKRIQGDVVFLPHYDVPLVGLPAASVVTVHDLIHFRLPEVFPGWKPKAASLLLRRAVSQAQRVIAVSESTRVDLVERYPDAGSKVTVIPNGVDPSFRATPEGRAASSDHRFLLCVGNRKPHKNQVAAVEVLAQLKPSFPDLRLVIAGAPFEGSEEIIDLAAARGVLHAVDLIDHAEEAELLRLYQMCEVLLIPSLYEGFGLPALEAMACGTPVIASNRSSLPEVVGDAGFLVDPHDYHSMTERTRDLLTNPGLRSELSRRGVERSRDFSWDRTAIRTAEVLHEVGRAGHRQRSAVSKA